MYVVSIPCEIPLNIGIKVFLTRLHNFGRKSKKSIRIGNELAVRISTLRQPYDTFLTSNVNVKYSVNINKYNVKPNNII